MAAGVTPAFMDGVVDVSLCGVLAWEQEEGSKRTHAVLYAIAAVQHGSFEGRCPFLWMVGLGLGLLALELEIKLA